MKTIIKITVLNMIVISWLLFMFSIPELIGGVCKEICDFLKQGALITILSGIITKWIMEEK